MEENVLSEQDIKANIQPQQTGEGKFVTTDTSGDYSMFGPPKGVITKVENTFEKDIIPGSSTVTSSEVFTDLSKVSNLPKIEDVMPTNNPEIKSEIESLYGYKDKSGVVLPFSSGLDANTKIRIRRSHLSKLTKSIMKKKS